MPCHDRLFAIGIVFASLHSGGCSDQSEISVDSDHTVDFARYSSFAWVGDEASAIPLSEGIPEQELAQIKSTIEAELVAKGYRAQADLEDADLGVSFAVGTNERMEQHIVSGFLAENHDQWNWGTQYFDRGEVGRSGARLVYRVETSGELSVTIFDAQERRPIWRASGARVLTKADIEGEVDSIAGDVSALLADLEPREGARTKKLNLLGHNR